jgi:hypothetical protein
LIFAIFCGPFPEQKVIYFAHADKLKDINKRYNRRASSLRKREEETCFVISPNDFYKKCEGYLDKSIVAKILKDEVGIELSPCVSIDDCLNRIGPLKEKQIEKFWQAAMKEIANNRGPNLADELGIGPD